MKRLAIVLATVCLVASTAAEAGEFDYLKHTCDIAWDKNEPGFLKKEFQHKDLTRKQCLAEYRKDKKTYRNWTGNISESMVGCQLYCNELYHTDFRVP